MARRNRSFSREVESAIGMAADRYGIDPNVMRGIARMESSGNPGLVNKYGYSGLFQLSRSEYQRVGGSRGNILDPTENAMAAARVFKGHQHEFEKTFNRPVSPAELYLIHNQGWGGFQAHMERPDRPAWENMARTREGRARAARDPDWPHRAVRENIPVDARRFGENLTSRQLMDGWIARVSREYGLGVDVPAPTTTASATTPGSDEFEATRRMMAQAGPSEDEALAFANTPSQDEALAFADRPNIEVAAAATPPPIVRGIDGPLSGDAGREGGMTMGGLFGNIGKGLSAAGKALSASSRASTSSAQPSIEAQMAALDQQPVTIQARKPRRPPAIGGRGGTA